MKKRLIAVVLALALMCVSLCACARQQTAQADVLATTAPVWAMTDALLAGTGLRCGRIITESVSCLHDYTLTVSQMQAIGTADVVVLNGLGLEDFMTDALQTARHTITASDKVETLPGEDGPDPHIWLSPTACIQMSKNIALGLQSLYPDQHARIADNLQSLIREYEDALAYGQAQLQELQCRRLVTFHDGFAYFAAAFDLQIAASMEIEHGSEPSAQELEAVIRLVDEQQLPAIFDEENGESSAAQTVARQTGAALFTLSMGMSEGTPGCTDAIYQNINTIQEALG